VWVNEASAYRPIGALSQTAGDGRRFRDTACDLSKVANCNFSTSVLSLLGLLVVTDRCVMFNVVVIISTTTQEQSDVNRIIHFRLTWYLSTTFRRHRNLFFKVRLQIFRRRVLASFFTMPADTPIRWCIINLHRRPRARSFAFLSMVHSSSFIISHLLNRWV